MNYSHSTGTSSSKVPKILLVCFIFGIALMIGTVLAIRHNYEQNLRPASSSSKAEEFIVESGETVKGIAASLEEQELIKASWAFEWYVRTNDLRESLLAGTYSLRPDMSVQQIVDILAQGKIATDLVTIPPGLTVMDIEDRLVNQYEFSREDVQSALNPGNYEAHPALVDKPVGVGLEGYIYPESFHRSSRTTPEEVIKLSLDQMQEQLTPALRSAIVRQGLTVHEGIILASIIEQEVSSPADKPTVAQVFLKRLREDIMLQSDPTAVYGAEVDGLALPSSPGLAVAKAIQYESPYNTYDHAGLPPGPISNVSESSLSAVANPSDTDYLFFVAGDDERTHFSKTLDQHEANIEKYCTELCGR